MLVGTINVINIQTLKLIPAREITLLKKKNHWFGKKKSGAKIVF